MAKNKEKTIEPIPENFTSIEAAAQFWETHSLADYWDQTHEVQIEVHAPRRQWIPLAANLASQTAERARQEEAERTRVEEGEARAQQATLQAAASGPVAVAAPAKIAGFSSRDNWVADFEPGKTEDDVKLWIIKAIVTGGRNDLLSLISLDAGAVKRLAKALRVNFNVPGMKAVNKPVAASRAA